MRQFDWLLSSLSFWEIDSQTILSFMGETKIWETIEGKLWMLWFWNFSYFLKVHVDAYQTEIL